MKPDSPKDNPPCPHGDEDILRGPDQFIHCRRWGLTWLPSWFLSRCLPPPPGEAPGLQELEALQGIPEDLGPGQDLGPLLAGIQGPKLPDLELPLPPLEGMDPGLWEKALAAEKALVAKRIRKGRKPAAAWLEVRLARMELRQAPGADDPDAFHFSVWVAFQDRLST